MEAMSKNAYVSLSFLRFLRNQTFCVNSMSETDEVSPNRTIGFE